jgi:nitrate/TMAO reductase-like tetraheme cytochrome c subunit
VRALAGLLIAALLGACQDTGTRPPLFTLEEAHRSVGLRGGHESVECVGCHGGNAYTAVDTTCATCHLDDFEATVDPHHTLLGYSSACTECHTSMAWRPATSHHDTSRFALEGAHRRLTCGVCHEGQLYEELPEDCWSCHQDDFEEVDDPDHVAAEFDPDCLACHTLEAWTPATFDHDSTGFALRNAHVGPTCGDCHTDGYQADSLRTCIDCHLDDFEATTDPDHVEADIDRDCAACHSDAAWEPSTFDHDGTGFALRGGHAPPTCVDCHADGYERPQPRDCVDCHLDDFEATTEPDHAEAEIDQDCAACHTVDAWEPATFDHDETGFVLDGAHDGPTCLDCHADGYAARPAPRECIDCHAEDEPPDHFTPLCADCHTTSAWEPSTFDHEMLFPLQRGEHSQYRNSCVSCHLDGSPYDTFTCTDCHDNEHEQPQMDREHDDVRDYVYDSAACLDCHPNGREDDAEDD